MSKIVGVHTSGSPIGSIQANPNTAVPNGWILTNNVSLGISGTTYAGSPYFALYSLLWAMAGISTTAGDPYVISSALGASALADWNAGKTITIDLRGHFLRNAGGNAGSIGAKQSDQFQGHYHQYNTSTAARASLGGSGYAASAPNDIVLNNGTISSPTNDGTNGVPRTGTETRPLNTAHTFIMSYV